MIHVQKNPQDYTWLQGASSCSSLTAVSLQEPVVKSAIRGSPDFLIQS